MARRFSFRFETLLRIRKQREDEKKRAVARRLKQLAVVRARHDNLASAIKAETMALRYSLRGETLDVDQFRWGRHWLTHLRRGLLEADAEIAAQRALLAQERAVLVEARKDTEVLARLKERRREAYLAESGRLEQIETDEMNTVRAAIAGIAESEDQG